MEGDRFSPLQLNILVVDDEPSARNLLNEIVIKEGHQAVLAESAEAILQLLPFWEFEAAFIDNHLSGMKGIVLCEYLRRVDPDLTLALVTGAPSQDTQGQCEELGITLITKPYDIDDVIAVIDECSKGVAKRNRRPSEPDFVEYAPPFSTNIYEAVRNFNIPGVPERIIARLTETIKSALNKLRSPHRFNEQDRMVALLGLLTSKTLEIRLPKSSSGHTLYEEYDQLMRGHRRREEFSRPRDTDSE